MNDLLIQRLRGWHSDGAFNVDDLHDWLDKNGVDTLGAGAYGAVVDCGDMVLKVFDATDDGYLQWINFCELVGPHRYLPRIFYNQKISKFLHVVLMEKLENYAGDINYDLEFKAIKAHKAQRFNNSRLVKDFVKTLNKDLHALLDLMAEYLEEWNAKIKEHNANTSWVNGDTYLFQIIHDLHAGNVMFRGKQLVITDPWCI